MTVSGPAVSGDIGWIKVKYTTPEAYPVFEKHPGSARRTVILCTLGDNRVLKETTVTVPFKM